MAGVVALSRVLVLTCALVATAGLASAQQVQRTPSAAADLSGTWTSRTMTARTAGQPTPTCAVA